MLQPILCGHILQVELQGDTIGKKQPVVKNTSDWKTEITSLRSKLLLWSQRQVVWIPVTLNALHNGTEDV